MIINGVAIPPEMAKTYVRWAKATHRHDHRGTTGCGLKVPQDAKYTYTEPRTNETPPCWRCFE